MEAEDSHSMENGQNSQITSNNQSKRISSQFVHTHDFETVISVTEEYLTQVVKV